MTETSSRRRAGTHGPMSTRRYQRDLRRLLTSGDSKALAVYHSIVDDIVDALEPNELFQRTDQLAGALLIEALYEVEERRSAAGSEIAAWTLPNLAKARVRVWDAVAGLIPTDDPGTTDAIESYRRQARHDLDGHRRSGWDESRPDLDPRPDSGDAAE